MFNIEKLPCHKLINAAPVIVFCRSGRRAGKAKEMLEQKGYTNVLNAGGLTDLTKALGSD